MTALTNGRVHFGRTGTVARITLHRPDNGNAVDLPMAEDLLEAAQKACSDIGNGLSVIVLDAAGPMFCVGGDLQDFASADDRSELMHQVTSKAHRAIELLAGAAVPVVTVVHGTAAGGGIGIALAGDIVLAADTAKFKMAYTAAGLTPDFGTSWRLSRDLGLARSLDLALTNRVFTAPEAHAWGLISRITGPDDLAGDAETLIALLADGPTEAFATTKALIRGSAGADLGAHLSLEAQTITKMVDEPAAHEGIDAFLNRRAPQFI